MSASADRDLLFGLVALQNHFIDQSDLIAAFHSWCEDRTRPLARILSERGAIETESAPLLDAIVARHLARFDGDAAKGLAALSSVESAREALSILPDPEIQASLVHVDTLLDDEVPATRMPLDSELPPIARFRILRPHARGGLGKVSVALDKELGREVAFKEIREEHADRRPSRQRFQLEAEITGSLEHPGVVPVYSLGQDGTGRPYYAMRFIRGESLQDAIRRFREADADPKRAPGERQLALRKLLGRFIDVCNTIAYAHSRGVLHRDLKPANIMLGDFGETLVVDWGLAKVLGSPEPGSGQPLLHPGSGSGSSDTQHGTALGTPGFISPEQALGKLESLGPASDIYSLGATLYVLLTGKPPFEGPADAVLARVPRGDFPTPRRVDPTVPKPLESICLKAMQLEPVDRYASARAFAEEIEHWLADEPVSAHQETVTARAARWTRRHRAATLAGVAALAVISLISSVAFVAVRHALDSEGQALLAQRSATAAAEHDRQRAERRETMAISAIERFEQAVIDNPQLRDDLALKPLRTTLLHEPLEFSRNIRRELQAEGDNRVDALERLADVSFSLGRTSREIGDHVDAFAAYRESLAIRERLTAENPNEARYAKNLASTLNNTALMASVLGKRDEALAMFKRAMEIQELLVRSTPGAVGPETDLAGTLNNYASELNVTGQVENAQAVYARSVGILETLARARPEDANIGRTLAASLNNLGNVLASTGRLPEALEILKRAHAVSERLYARDPKNAEFASDLGSTLNNFAVLQRKANQKDASTESAKQALKIREQLAKEHPARTNFQVDLANSYATTGSQEQTDGKVPEALASYRRAQEVLDMLTHDFPNIGQYQNELAAVLEDIGNLESIQGRNEPARVAFERSISILEQLVKDNPSVQNYQRTLAMALNNIGTLQDSMNQKTAAIASYRRALQIYEKLAESNPTTPKYQRDLSTCHFNIGALQSEQNLPKEALESYLKATAILDHLVRDQPDQPEYRMALGIGLTNLGVLQSRSNQRDVAYQTQLRAREIREALATKYPRAAELKHQLGATHYNIACLLALKAAGEKGDAAKSLADQAMESLKQADQCGFANWKLAAVDNDLAALRPRGDFQALIKKAGATSK